MDDVLFVLVLHSPTRWPKTPWCAFLLVDGGLLSAGAVEGPVLPGQRIAVNVLGRDVIEVTVDGVADDPDPANTYSPLNVARAMHEGRCVPCAPFRCDCQHQAETEAA